MPAAGQFAAHHGYEIAKSYAVSATAWRDGGGPDYRKTLLVPFLVSFSYVLRHPARTTQNRRPRSRTLLTDAERRPTNLESVLGATPQEFESLILRHREQ